VWLALTGAASTPAPDTSAEIGHQVAPRRTAQARSSNLSSKSYTKTGLGHERPSHGLNPQESARNHGYGASGAVGDSAANCVLEFTYKYL
jgi:hypothetical protein